MLCQFSLDASADGIYNLHVDMNGKTLEKKISDTIGSTTRLSNFHNFGCPVYILDACLKSVGGGGHPKWDPRACLGIFIGHSPYNAGSVALVMNPKSGLVYPKFHLVVDDNF